MSKIKLFIATTLDGYIARENHSLDWLYELEPIEGVDYGYNEMLSNVDTILIGRQTYEEILDFGGEWPYAELKTIVCTSNKSYLTKTPNTLILNQISKESIEQLKSDSKKDIWIVGGGQIITEFMNKNAIDEMLLSVVPRILGAGIPLFANKPSEKKLTLIRSESFENGVVNLSYRITQS